MATSAAETGPDATPQAEAPAATQPSSQDKRNSPRRDIERSVQIIANGAPPLVCALSDVSKSGARLSVADPSALPDEFEILFKDDLRKWCRVMRRSEKHIGIKFVHRPLSAANVASPPVVPADAAPRTEANTKAKADA